MAPDPHLVRLDMGPDRAVGSRIPSGAAQLVLNIYPALSLLSLLLFWLIGLVRLEPCLLGFRRRNSRGRRLRDAPVLRRVISFDPVVRHRHGAALRALSLFETVTGLGTRWP